MVEKEGEEKYFLIDLGTAINKDTITLFSSTTIGDVDIYANVYTEADPRCPTEDDNDFIFGRIETQIKTDSINNKI